MVRFAGGGRTYNPYAFDTPAQKRRRLDATADLATSLGLPEVGGFLEEAADLIDATGDQLVPQDHRLGSTSRAVRSGSRRMPRSRRFTRRRRRRGKASRAFTKKTGSALLKLKPTNRFLSAFNESNFTAGDGTTRRLYIYAPVSNIPVSTGTSGFENTETLWLKAIKVRGRLSLDQTTNSIRCRMLVIWTNQFADLPDGWTTYDSATTALTNPTQAAADLESNIRIFETSDAEETGQPSAPFVGNATGIDIIDTQLVTVLGGREWFLSTQHLLNFINFDMYVPINRKWRMHTEFGSLGTDQKRSHQHGNYYVIFQVFSNSNANNILAAQDVLMVGDVIAYFKPL